MNFLRNSRKRTILGTHFYFFNDNIKRRKYNYLSVNKYSNRTINTFKCVPFKVKVG